MRNPVTIIYEEFAVNSTTLSKLQTGQSQRPDPDTASSGLKLVRSVYIALYAAALEGSLSVGAPASSRSFGWSTSGAGALFGYTRRLVGALSLPGRVEGASSTNVYNIIPGSSGDAQLRTWIEFHSDTNIGFCPRQPRDDLPASSPLYAGLPPYILKNGRLRPYRSKTRISAQLKPGGSC